MSDFSGLQPSFGGATGTLVPAFGELPPPPSNDILPQELAYRRLRAREEIARILPLRRELQSPAAADAGFASREKKGTTRGWWAASSGVATTSERSACCR